MNPTEISFEIAQDAQEQIKELEWEENTDPRLETRGVYLGTFNKLDPCGHCAPNAPALSFSCRDFWKSLKNFLEARGMELEEGKGENPSDRFATQHRIRKGQKRPYYVWGINGDA